MIQNKAVEFASRADGTHPLFAEVFWHKDSAGAGRKPPVVAVMPGYQADRQAITGVCRRFAGGGVCAVAIDMRGRGESAGAPDSGAVEIHDVVDALDAAAERFHAVADFGRCSIVGYSGGGGNALSAITKFPDRFQIGVSFFGISDYEYWYRSEGRPDCNALMRQWIGGTPDEFRGRYLARNSALAGGNCPNTEVHLFWDEEERACPGRMNELFAGNTITHMSRKTDRDRWIHGYPDNVPSLIKAEEIILPRIRERAEDLSLPRQGHLVVPGFVVTSQLSYWIGDGKQGMVKIEYDLGPPVSIRVLKTY